MQDVQCIERVNGRRCRAIRLKGSDRCWFHGGRPNEHTGPITRPRMLERLGYFRKWQLRRPR